MDLAPNFVDHLEGLSIEYRDYQISAVQELLECFPNNSVLLNYPYGTGKTVIALLLFLAIKLDNPDARFIFTSAREAAALRCRQALEMAKKFGFIDKIGFLYDPQGKGLSLKHKNMLYSEASVIFSPITKLMNDRFEIKSRLKSDILNPVHLCVIDEATDVLARDLSGFRLSKHFESLFHYRTQESNFPILAMTGTRDQYKAKAIVRQLGKNTTLLQRLDLSPYETVTQIHQINRPDYIKIDQTISIQLTQPIETIQKLLDPKLNRLDIIKLTYGGFLDRLKVKKPEYPARIGKYTIKDEETNEELAKAFITLFKLSHSRLLLLESTPGAFLTYIDKEENREMFKKIITASQDIIAYRVELPDFAKPKTKTTRGLIQPKVSTAINIINDHLTRGAQILLFTRYLALGAQLAKLLKALNFPNVGYLSGKVPEDTRRLVIQDFNSGNIDVLIFTPVGGRGLNLEAADVVIHLDITTNLDEMVQRRERARGCLEYVLVLQETSEERKIQEYLDLIKLD